MASGEPRLVLSRPDTICAAVTQPVADAAPPSLSPVRGWRAWPRRVLAGPVHAYRLLLSPWLGSSCRFEPSCSRYALDALARHGAAAGSYLTAARLLRCHPACAGGCDPVPVERPRLFRHLFAEASGPGAYPSPVAKTSSGPSS
ncbi:hypothetical protein GCM10009107_10530 [Ideonella azotifigens]|uniref:Putative membrane protein insertion efficiency factor n=1 Tax=Ideonella azotifigens TaxID=513160 RepID=A0ABN1JQN6_9BURK